MKHLFAIVFLVLLGGGICAQPALEEKVSATKSALAELDQWHQNYWHYYETNRFDEALACFAPTAVVVENGKLYRYAALEKLHEEMQGRIINMEVHIDSSSIELLGNNHAAIQGFCFSTQDETTSKPHCMRFSYLMLLEKEQGDWQIQSIHEDVNYCPLLYGSTLPASMRKGQISQDLKFLISMEHMYFFVLNDLARFKELGLSIEERASEMGEIIAAYWSDDINFERFCQGCIGNSQAFTTRAEVLERSDDILKIRYLKNYREDLPDNMTDAEFLKFWEITNQAVTDKLGIDMSIIDEGDYYTATFRKQN